MSNFSFSTNNAWTLPPPPPTLSPSYRMEGPSNDNKENDLTLGLLKELCEHPTLYVTTRAVSDQNADKNLAVTISNKEPEINSENLDAKYPEDSIVIDIFFSKEINSLVINMSYHWTKIVCSILTFRGHEVFLNNKIFIPFEQE